MLIYYQKMQCLMPLTWSLQNQDELHRRYLRLKNSFFFTILMAVLICQVIRGHYTSSNEVILEDLSLPGLGELKGRWHGSLDASGGGNGDTMVDIFKSLHTIAIGVFVERSQWLNVDQTGKNKL